jgi:hypothetical protein
MGKEQKKFRFQCIIKHYKEWQSCLWCNGQQKT